jgi:ABC-type uncharacterized transport system permease subunit
VLPRWLLPVATVTAVVSYVAWTAAAAGDYAGKGLLTAVFASLFWLSIMALVAVAVRRGVDRRRGRR